jgi:amino acid adenylation domain-containing protein/non-ribosomal peptide synthase protein (TIGR01720 family)
MDKKVIHSVFEEVVKRYPSKIAIELGEDTITYEALNRYANRLAHLLAHTGSSTGDIVHVVAPPSIRFVGAMLSVFKSGGIFLPVDLSFAEKRLRQVFTETFGGIVMVAEESFESLLSVAGQMGASIRHLVVLKESGEIGLYGFSDGQPVAAAFPETEQWSGNLPLTVNGESSNYIYYTSGSTGDAKAILGAHAGLSHFIHWEIKEFGLDDATRVTQLAQVTFDASLRDIFTALISGGTLCIPSPEVRGNPRQLLNWLESSRITLVHCVPSLFRVLTRELASQNTIPDLSSIRNILMAGEMLYAKDIINWQKLAGSGTGLVNFYGPTETTLIKTFYRIQQVPENPAHSIPAGLPISNTVVAIIQDERICKVGEIGEIYIKTPFMTKGYYKNEKLTRQSFVQNPLSNDPADIVYKTGDLGRWLPDGNMEVLGRLDSQVKVNGIRVELAEIEKAMLELDNTTGVVVKTHRTDDNLLTLIAYYTGEKTEPDQLRDALGRMLNQHMIPSYFIHMDQFPVNANGKTDKKALPLPEDVLMGDVNFEPPAPGMETTLAEFWKEILGLKKIGRNISFFNIGGHSLRAIQLISRIQKEFGVELKIAEVFTNRTIRELAELVARTLPSGGYAAIEPAPEQEDYVLSSSQRRMWLLSQFQEANIAYNMNGVRLFEGTLDLRAFLQAFQSLLVRHESLRTVFRENEQGELRQVILPAAVAYAFAIYYKDLRGKEEQQALVKRLVQMEHDTAFDLSSGPLLRASLYQVEDNRWVFSYAMHHIISDGWSMRLLESEVMALYQAYARSEENPLQPLRIHYKDFALWEQQQLSGEQLQQHRDYWTEQLQGPLPVLDLPADRARPLVKTYRGGMLYKNIDAETTQELKALGEQQGATLFMALIAAVNTLLYRYSGQQDIIIGSPTAGREHVDLENQIGCYVNTLALRTRFNAADSYKEILDRVKQVTLEAYEHQVFPFDELLGILELPRDSARNPLFDVTVVLQNTELAALQQAEPAGGELRISPYGIGEHVSSKFDLTFNFVEMNGGLHMALEYNSDLFDRSTAERIATHLEQLLHAALREPGKPVQSLAFLNAGEERQLLHDFNDTNVAWPSGKTINTLFEEQVEKTPDAIALVFEERSLTYRQLNETSNQLAHYLKTGGDISPDEFIAIQLERSEWMIIAILAVLKSGAAYVPIDNDYPAARIGHMLEDSKSRMVIDTALLERFRSEQDQYGKENPSTPGLLSSHPAYAMYTSGSTGQPKGVLVEHRSVVRLVCPCSFAPLTGNEVLLGTGAFSFDATTFEYWSMLLHGGTLVLCPKETLLDSQKLRQEIESRKVDMMWFTAGWLHQLVDEDPSVFAGLKTVLTGGDKLSVTHINRLHQRYPGLTIINGYGPTENTTFSLTYEIPAGASHIPIGKPISNSTAYVLDAQGQLCPVGVAGELCVGGAGLARGYLNNPELTEEKFIAHPFVQGEKLYRTGDMARWLPDGNVEFLGRKDDQVKIRGYRIEIGEIEKALQSYRGMDAAVVQARSVNGGDKLLVAYMVGSKELHTQELRSYLSKLLPDYMIPSHFVQLEALPLNANGKVDLHALPDPQGLQLGSGAEYVAARTETERHLVEVYEEVLRRKGVSVKDDFFALGGDSIKSIQIVSRMKQRGYGIAIKDILLCPSIQDLATRVKSVTRQAEQGLVTGEITLSPVQQWFFNGNPSTPHHFNQSVLLWSKKPLAEEGIRAVFDKLVLHHDALRMVYRQTDSGWVQENKGREHGYAFGVFTYDEATFAENCDRIQSTINLQEGPLFKVALFHGNDGDRLLLVAHHLVIDGVSWRILFEDISTLYQQYTAGAALALPAKTDPFKYWQEKQMKYASSEKLAEEEAYWSAIESLPVKPLPQDHDGGKNTVVEVASLDSLLDENLTERLLTKTHHAYRTEVNDVLLTALGLALEEVFGLDRVVIGMEGHGREDIGADVDISRTVGWFTTIYPVAFNMNYKKDIIRQLIEVKETLHRVPNKGIGYGVLRYMAGKNYKLKPQVSFNYLGDFGSGIDTEQGEQLFEFRGDYHGRQVSADTQRTSLLDMSGMVVNGKLRLMVGYSREQFEAATMQRLLDSCRQHLETLVDRLAAEENTRLTPVDLTYKELKIEEIRELEKKFKLEDVYPLSPLQQGLYYHWLSSPEAYFEQMSYQLTGNLDIEKIAQSYHALVSRHAMLRTCFREDYGQGLLQVVQKSVPSTFRYTDLSGEEKAAVEAFKEEDKARGFDLNSGSQMRLTVIGLGNNLYEFIWSHHHILMDGWCISVLINEFYEIYNSLVQEREARLDKVYPYSSYIKWLSSVNRENSFRYWNGYLAGYDTINSLPRIKEKEEGEPLHRELQFPLDASVRQSMKTLCEELGVTENTFIQMAWGILLGRYNNTDDVVFGTVVSGRPPEVEGVEQMIGLFINTIPVRVRADRKKTAKEILKEVQQVSIEGMGHHYTQLAEIQAQSQLGRDLVDHLLLFENYPVQEKVKDDLAAQAGEDDLTLLSATISDQNNYDFTLVVLPGETITISFRYNARVYDDGTMERLQRHFSTLVQQVVEQPAKAIGTIEYLGETEKNQLLLSFNDTAEEFSAGKTIVSLFEERAAQHPGHTAVVCEDRALTYAELNEQADRLAGYLRKTYNTAADDLVGILLDRSEKMIIAVLGVLKAGAAYVPIDPDYPRDRKEYMIQDSALKVLITQTDYFFESMEFFSGDVFAIDIQLDTLEANDEQLTAPAPGSLAYVIYTSGSTGKPKGVMIGHKAIANTVQSQQRIFGAKEGEHCLQFASLSFDASVSEIFVALCSGAVLYVAKERERKDPRLLEQYLAEHSIDLATLPPAYLKMMDPKKLLPLKRLVTAGELATGELLAGYEGVYYNAYGPTETSICASVFQAEGKLEPGPIPIGKPIHNAQVYIVDASAALVAVGVAGEICVSGAGLARGYLNRPELTAEKFVASPFREGERMYRTGDLGRWLPDGTIEFLGRKDDQVKIRGYRIELGEIEVTLQKHPAIESCAVIVHGILQGEKELVAYIVSEQELNTAEVRSWLDKSLPGYMIPAHFVQLEALPLTANGKLDRKALPDPQGAALGSGVEYAAARTEIEKCLVAVYEEVLKRQPIGIREDFFALGGDSIKSIQIVSRMKQRGYALAIQDILLYPSIEDLATRVSVATRQAEQGIISGEIDLSPIQHWFFNGNPSTPHHYNQSVLLASKKPLVEKGIRVLFDKLVLHHDALRMVFRQTPSGWVQENKGREQGYSFELLAYDEASFAEHCDRIQSTINLQEGPLFKVALFRGTDGDRLLMVAHHLVMDGVSWRILFEDISTLYQQYAEGVALELPAKTDPFRLWQEKQMEYAFSKKLAEEEAYWSAIESLPIKPLPQDHEGRNTLEQAASLSAVLDESLTERLLTKTYQAYRTEVNDVLLTALGLALEDVFGMDRVLIGMEGHGREDIGADVDVSRTVGWFTTIYPVALDMSHKADIIRQLTEVKETLHRVPNKGIGYGVLRYLAKKDYRLEPQISFNYLGDFGSGIQTEQGEQLFEFPGGYQGHQVPVDMQRPSVLEVSGVVVAGQLRLAVSYSREQYEVATMQRLLDSCYQHLENLIGKLAAEENTHLTPVDLTFKGLSIEEVRELDKQLKLEDVYLLSPMQEGLYYHWHDSREIYLEQMSYQLTGNLDVAKIEQSYHALTARHAMLRTCFREDLGQELLQVVQREVPSTFRYIDLCWEKDVSVEAWKEADKTKGFDLGNGSQMRLTVLGLGNNLYEFIWSHHHILMDGWCVGMLIKEFYEIYNSLVHGREPKLEKIYPYSNYIKWLYSVDREKSFRYWSDYLAGYDTISTLPRTKAEEGESLHRQMRFSLDAPVRQSMKSLCEELGVTENTFVQTVWGVLLSRYNNTADVVFGAVVSGRPPEVEGVEQMIGLFINAIPVRIRTDREKSAREILKEVQQASIQGMNHHYTQLADIQTQSPLGRDLIDHLVVFENYPVQQMVEDGAAPENGGGELTLLSASSSEHSNYDFTLLVQPGNNIDIIFSYNIRAFDEAAMERLKEHFSSLVQKVLEQPAKAIGDIDIDFTTQEAKQKIDEVLMKFGMQENF